MPRALSSRKYIAVNSPTFIIRQAKRQASNKTGVVRAMFFNDENIGQWFINIEVSDYLLEKSGVTINPRTLNTALRRGSSTDESIVKQCRQNFLIRKKITKSDRVANGWNNRKSIYKYTANVRGNAHGAPAVLDRTIENLTMGRYKSRHTR